VEPSSTEILIREDHKEFAKTGLKRASVVRLDKVATISKNKAGSVFAILTPRKGNVVVLKKIDSKSLQADLRIFREIEKAWREIERGQARRAPRKRFLEELETW
jgi:hypothetical protein